ncbi:MAG: HIT family protein [Betaproteobacteria bacterium]|nr:HIT family protein [Betaproteobacteria bacterium]
MPPCPLCTPTNEDLLWQDDFCRVILVDDPAYPGFCRVILNAHAKEMTDLPEQDRQRLMDVVFAVEAAVREVVQPDKVNLASLGNMVPHLHWHVIPRFADDPHFPDAIWAAAKRAGTTRPVENLRPRLLESLRRRLGPPAAG